MKYTVQKDNCTPSYIQLYRQVRDDIVNEIYRYNSKLPSKRVIAAETGVSIVTAEHAYELLCDEGYIEARERSGYFVIFCASDGFAASNQTVIHTLMAGCRHCASTEFPFSVLAKTMRRIINEFGETILDKSPNYGCVELREAIREYLARNRGIIADIEQIIIGSGSEYLYTLIVELLGRNRIFAIESPSYKKLNRYILPLM